jgi:hypothetical protein
LKAIGESTPTTGCNKTLRTKKKKWNGRCYVQPGTDQSCDNSFT